MNGKGDLNLPSSNRSGPDSSSRHGRKGSSTPTKIFSRSQLRNIRGDAKQYYEDVIADNTSNKNRTNWKSVVYDVRGKIAKLHLSTHGNFENEETATESIEKADNETTRLFNDFRNSDKYVDVSWKRVARRLFTHYRDEFVKANKPIYED